MSSPAPYNPLDKSNLGASVAEALLARVPESLQRLAAFAGAGIYAIYYKGDFDAYQRLALKNRGANPSAPIYVGKAVPEGSRKGEFVVDANLSKSLFKRLREHRKSIDEVGNLRIEDFVCRHLVLDDVWIPLGESLLIAKFAPIWNTKIDGFGNHTPGKKRFEGMRPRWDVLHPGRAWAAKCADRPETATQIAREVKAHLVALGPP